MTDETTDREVVETAAGTPEAEAPERDEPLAEQDIDRDSDDDAPGGEGDEPPEEIEFDFGGNKMRVPKGSVPEELAAKIDQFTKGAWSEYTRKSQGVAEQAKSIEARERAVEIMSTLNDDVINEYSQGLGIKRELDQLSRVDLNALWQSDPDRARRVSDTIQRKQAEFQTIVATVGAKEAALNEARDREVSRRRDEGKAAAEKLVKGFNEKIPEVIDYVSKTYGMPKDALERDWPLNPATATMAYKAMLYDRMQTKAKSPAPTQAPNPVKPMAPGRGGREVKDPARMPMNEYAEYMNQQERRKATSGRR